MGTERLKYLVDTNIWLEKLLEQAKRLEVDEFFRRIPAAELALTDFALFSIGIALTRGGAHAAFAAFLEEIITPDDVSVLSIQPDHLRRVVETATRLGLDFDDAYQYVAAENHGLIIVSFDADFDRTPKGRKSPLAAT